MAAVAGVATAKAGAATAAAATATAAALAVGAATAVVSLVSAAAGVDALCAGTCVAACAGASSCASQVAVAGASVAVVAAAMAPATAQTFSREQDIGAMRLGQKVLVDDGTCPAGQVKGLRGVPRTVAEAHSLHLPGDGVAPPHRALRQNGRGAVLFGKKIKHFALRVLFWKAYPFRHR